MSDINEILRLNPKAADSIEDVYQVLQNIKELRAAGFAKGPDLTLPGRHRKSVADLKSVRRQTIADLKQKIAY